MEIRGMLGGRPVKLIVVRNEWLDVIDLVSGEEIVRQAIHRDIYLDGDYLDIGELSIAVDRTYFPEAQNLVKLVSQLPVPRPEPLVWQSGFCTQCGNSVVAAARFCSTCGNSLGEPIQQVPSSPQQHLEPVHTPTSHEIDDDNWQYPEPSQVQRNYVMTVTGRRNLLFAVTALVVIIVAVVAIRNNYSNSSTASSGDVRSSSACATLSSYAYNGIPATFIDDGARLLYGLSDQFRSMGRGDIANRIDNIVDLTYAGPGGQLSAKNELLSAASSYC